MTRLDEPGSDADILAPLRARVVPEWQEWWLACDEGWWPLLARLADDLTTIEPDWTLRQAKEKFGVLNFWPSLTNHDPAVADRFRDRIYAAEMESSRTCERCGQPGGLCRTEAGYYKTLCEACREVIEAEGGQRYFPLRGEEPSDD